MECKRKEYRTKKCKNQNPLYVLKQEMPQILTIAVGEIIHTCIRNLEKSNINVKQDYFSKRSKFGYYMRFPSTSFLKENPLGFICAWQ